MAPGFELVFRQMSPALVVLKPDKPKYTIVDANEAYLKATNSKLEDIIGKGVFEAFPENEEGKQTEHGGMTRQNLDMVVATKQPFPTFLVKYAIKFDGQFFDMYWSIDNVPVMKDGEILYIAQHPKPITALNKTL
jgi:PAS domain-containing protein